MNHLFSTVRERLPGLLSVSFRRGFVPIKTFGRAASQTATTQATQKLRPQTNKEYFLSTHFWGPVANWGFVLAVIFHIQLHFFPIIQFYLNRDYLMPINQLLKSLER